MERQEILTDIEFNILDELYFVISYEELREKTGYTDAILSSHLTKFINNGFVRIYKSMDEEVDPNEIELTDSLLSYWFLATKRGLQVHNSR